MNQIIEKLSLRTSAPTAVSPTPSASHVAFTKEDIATANKLLEGKSPQEILRWAVKNFHPKLTMATAFGAEGCCLIHMLAEIEPAVRIFNLDTGYQFPETLELRERIKT